MCSYWRVILHPPAKLLSNPVTGGGVMTPNFRHGVTFCIGLPNFVKIELPSAEL